MNDTPPKPCRKRRRWLVVGVLVSILTVAGWWSWPSADARLVGKWESPDRGKGAAQLELRSNGLGFVRSGGSSGGYWFLWSVEDDRLVIGHEPVTPLSRGLTRCMIQLFKLAGRSRWFGLETEFRIIEVSADELVLEQTASKERSHYRRTTQ